MRPFCQPLRAGISANFLVQAITQTGLLDHWMPVRVSRLTTSSTLSFAGKGTDSGVRSGGALGRGSLPASSVRVPEEASACTGTERPSLFFFIWTCFTHFFTFWSGFDIFRKSRRVFGKRQYSSKTLEARLSAMEPDPI